MRTLEYVKMWHDTSKFQGHFASCHELCYGIVSRSVLAKLLINANRLLPQPIMAWLSLQISGWYLAVVYICFRIPFIVVPVALLIFSRSHIVWWSHNSIYIYIPMYNIRVELCFTHQRLFSWTVIPRHLNWSASHSDEIPWGVGFSWLWHMKIYENITKNTHTRNKNIQKLYTHMFMVPNVL